MNKSHTDHAIRTVQKNVLYLEILRCSICFLERITERSQYQRSSGSNRGYLSISRAVTVLSFLYFHFWDH